MGGRAPADHVRIHLARRGLAPQRAAAATRLLHTVAVPQVVTGHEARLGEWWILELDHDSETGLRRAELVQTLTDPEHGLPLELGGRSGDVG
ncbi:hypothetical protein [Streptomyces sp. NPDC002553]|uniref:hypothetical protein n=1 Tax=Streptomyces sp. NPDC002553 TaxID=3154417 RepID=UPI0033233BE0